jgi:hypothetical protein
VSRRRPRCRALAAVTAVAAIVSGGFTSASGAPGAGRSLAVSVPPEPTPIVAGGIATIPIKVLNPGNRPVTVTITNRGVELGDNGAVTIGAGPDPRWQGQVVFPAAPVTIAAQGFVDVDLPVQMPPVIAPDLYFVGFLVSPVKTGQSDIQVINQIGSFITVDVPGPRQRELTADLHLPRFKLGSTVAGLLQVHNVGKAAARFWGENDTTSSPGRGTPQQQRIEKSTLPIGRVRSFQVSGKPHWPIGFVTMKVRITYPDQTDAATKDILITRRVLVISPWVLVVIGGLCLLAIAWGIHRHRRKRVNTVDETLQARRRRLLYQSA